MMFIDLLDDDVQQITGYFCCVTGLKYLEYNPGSELNILLMKMNIESWIEQNNQMKLWTKVEQKLNKDK